MRDFLDKDVTILKETINGIAQPLTLLDLRLRVESNPTLFDADDIGGCGCFVDEEMLE